MAALFHDVGKIRCRRDLIRRNGVLTPTEKEHIYNHPENGGNILYIYGLERFRKGVVSHHERWDGSGYPYGLKRRRIPMVGRIIGVADSWDAMRTRDWNCKSFEEAKKELGGSAGVLYDPLVIVAFLVSITT